MTVLSSALADASVALQWHYQILQAMALEEDLPEKPTDRTVPKYRQIDKVGHSASDGALDDLFRLLANTLRSGTRSWTSNICYGRVTINRRQPHWSSDLLH